MAEKRSHASDRGGARMGVVNVVPPTGRLRLTTPRPEPAETITEDLRARPGAGWSDPVRQGPGTGPLFAQSRPAPGGQVAPHRNERRDGRPRLDARADGLLAVQR